jgi:hypothetical protein
MALVVGREAVARTWYGDAGYWPEAVLGGRVSTGVVIRAAAAPPTAAAAIIRGTPWSPAVPTRPAVPTVVCLV